MYARVCVCVHICKYTHTDICMCMQIHMYIHAHARTHTGFDEINNAIGQTQLTGRLHTPAHEPVCVCVCV